MLTTSESRIIHHENILKFLEMSVKNNRIAHAYIFNGQDGIGKLMVAKRLASLFLCAEHINTRKATFNSICNNCVSCIQISKDISPDVIVIRKDDTKKNIPIDTVRDLTHGLSTKSFNERKIIIIDGANYLSEQAANAMLKTLEEPISPVIIILITSSINIIPKTIISRAQVINFYPVPSKKLFNYLVEIGVRRELALTLSRLAFGSPGKVLKYIKDDVLLSSYNQSISQLIDLTLADLKDCFEISAGLLPSKGISFNETVGTLEHLFDLWLLVLRDVILLQSNNNQAVVHVFMLDKLKKAASQFSVLEICKLMQKIMESKLDLRLNILPQLIFDNLLLSFKV